jgi:trehalose/maltose hydrolase-like predicted phosphorylase
VRVWSLEYDEFVPEQEGLREALCTLGNGYFATRGAAPEARADGVHYPGTYVAGCYDRLATEVAGRTVANEDLVNVPNWLPLSFRVGGGRWLDLRKVDILAFRQELDLRRGVLARHLRYRDPSGPVTSLHQRRFVHMDDPHLAGIETVLIPEDWSGPVRLRSVLDGDIENDGVPRYRDLRGDHLVPVAADTVDRETVVLRVATRRSGIGIAEAARTRLWRNDQAVPGRRRVIRGSRSIGQSISVELDRGDHLRIEKIVGLHTSRDPGVSEAGLDARLRVAGAASFEELLARHTRAWNRAWKRIDVSIEGSPRAQLILRLHAFHLLQTVSNNTIGLDVGVPARGLHGEAYRGHIFWDELFILPFLDLRLPALSESLLAYRHRRLEAARRAAEAEGYRGAMYPWQSASSGREETQTLHLNPNSGRWLPDHSHLQRHINIAIAYNVWHHFQATGDLQFLRVRGLPMMLEIARFWASLATPRRPGTRYEIRGVMGPDEYHESYPGASSPGLDNNAYTNVMVAWVLTRAFELLALLPEHDRLDLADQLQLTARELAHWEELSRRLVVPFHDDGVISQFEGYEELEELDWTGYVERYGDIQRLDRILEAEGDSTNRYQLSKQADVLMLLYLLPPEELQSILERLGYRFDPNTDIERTIDYYFRRTSHGSTLSRVVHAWVLARFDRQRSWEQFRLGLESDFADVQGGTTAEGIHLGAMVGTLDIVQRCYGGVEIRGDEVVIRPRLPQGLRAIGFPVYYRARKLEVHITSARVRIRLGPGAQDPIRLRIWDERIDLPPGTEIIRESAPDGPAVPRP